MPAKKEEYDPYLYLPVVSVEIDLTVHYREGGQIIKSFKSIEDVADFFKDHPRLRVHFTRAGQQAKADRGEDMDSNF